MIVSLMMVALGILLTIAPDLLSYADHDAALVDRVVGPVLTAFAVLTIWDVLSPLRWACALTGIALLVSPLWSPWATASAVAAHLIVAPLVIALSLLRAPRTGKYAGGWSALWRRDAPWSKITWS